MMRQILKGGLLKIINNEVLTNTLHASVFLYVKQEYKNTNNNTNLSDCNPRGARYLHNILKYLYLS